MVALLTEIPSYIFLYIYIYIYGAYIYILYVNRGFKHIGFHASRSLPLAKLCNPADIFQALDLSQFGLPRTKAKMGA